MRVSVEIRGDGVAARCCAHLFAKSRIPVVWQPCERPRLPAILLSEPAQALISDVFGRKDLFAGLPAIRKRIVCWGRGASPVALDHSAVVVSEEVLLQRLQAAMPAKAPVRDRPAGWTIHASRPLPDSASEHRFGSRMATATRVELKPTTEPPACWIESVEDGWLFLIEDAPRAGWLLSVGSNSEKLLGKSRLIGEQAAACGPAGAPFDASPRIVSPLGEPGWLACGTRLCGAFGFSNDRSLTYWVLIWIGKPCGAPASAGRAPGWALAPLLLSVIGAVLLANWKAKVARRRAPVQPPP